MNSPANALNNGTINTSHNGLRHTAGTVREQITHHNLITVSRVFTDCRLHTSRHRTTQLTPACHRGLWLKPCGALWLESWPCGSSSSHWWYSWLCLTNFQLYPQPTNRNNTLQKIAITRKGNTALRSARELKRNEVYVALLPFFGPVLYNKIKSLYQLYRVKQK